MANKPSRPSTPRSEPTTGAPARRSNLLWLWVGLGAVVLLALGFAVLSAGDDEEVTTGGSGQPGETQPVTITGATLEPLPDSGDDPAVGTAAPELSGFDFDGTPVSIDPSDGPVMLVFLAHWCPHCNREVPQLNAWRDAGGVPDDLQVVAVTTAVSAEREHYPPSTWIRDEMGWTWPVLADSPDNKAAFAYGVSGFPFSVIVDTDGTVLGRASGELGLEGIEAFVAASLAKAG